MTTLSSRTRNRVLMNKIRASHRPNGVLHKVLFVLAKRLDNVVNNLSHIVNWKVALSLSVLPVHVLAAEPILMNLTKNLCIMKRIYQFYG